MRHCRGVLYLKRTCILSFSIVTSPNYFGSEFPNGMISRNRILQDLYGKHSESFYRFCKAFIFYLIILGFHVLPLREHF